MDDLTITPEWLAEQREFAEMGLPQPFNDNLALLDAYAVQQARGDAGWNEAARLVQQFGSAVVERDDLQRQCEAARAMLGELYRAIDSAVELTPDLLRRARQVIEQEKG